MILVRAPLRLSLGGGGTDLPSYFSRHGGFILGGAIDKFTGVCINRPAVGDGVGTSPWWRERTTGSEEVDHRLLRAALRVSGVTENVEVASLADVPSGTGLGSSGSYVVALLAGLHELTGEPLSRWALADLAVHVEADLAGRPVGKQDHYLAAFGGLVCLEIDRDGTVRNVPLEISPTTCASLQRRLLLFFTGIRRRADHILAAQRGGSADGDPLLVESLHRTKALGRQIKQALENGDLDTFGHLLHEHWIHKRRRSKLISDERVDQLYELAREAGALGGKVVGAGGGGFLAVYCPDGSGPNVRAALTAEGLQEMPYRFAFEGVQVVSCS